MSSSLPLSLNPTLNLHRHHVKTQSFFLKPSIQLSLSKTHICFTSTNGSNNPEELLWLREEQRWLREEQRWLREEQRWVREREALLAEIQALKLQVQALESRISVQGGDSLPESMAKVGALLQILKEKNLIAENGSSGRPIEVVEDKVEVKEVDRVSEAVEGKKEVVVKKRNTLRTGSEGEEVREMQEALQVLGFYSGEEDMEFSSFSSGTERAVKTWQATLGAREDGIMTSELLERLYMEQRIEIASNDSEDQKGSAPNVPQDEVANGAAVTSVTEISEMEKKVVKEGDKTEVEVSQQRVFLLGENRWEEPARLVGRDRQVDRSTSKKPATRCLTCRGEGRLMCTECDGTGEPNIEPQFLEWVGEDAKCPYCEGLGYTICDVCDGKSVV